MTLEDLRCGIKFLFWPGSWSGDSKEGVQEKNKHSTLKAYFHNKTHEQADFFSAEPQLLQYRCTALKVSRSSICCTVS